MDKKDVNKYFEKKFTFPQNTSTKLLKSQPLIENQAEILNKLVKLKETLNNTKSKTGNYDLTKWSYHTKARDLSQELFKKVKGKYNPELLTQAWFKSYEILSNFPVAKPDGETNILCSVHLCEAPGAFITSLNHYLASNYVQYELHYLANTLNPYYSGNKKSDMIGDDRFIMHSIDNWYFGIDDTGDIMQHYNYLGLIKEVKTKFNKVHLCTADGSVNCMKDPGNQENTVAHLIFCETVTALSILSEGGNFILKIFTMFEKSTIGLLKLLHYCFAELTIFKPFTSKAGNSELYIICTNYNGSDSLNDLWPTLMKFYISGSSAELYSYLEISNDFLEIIYDAANYYSNYQMRSINKNILTFKCPIAEDLDILKENLTNYYLNEKCNIHRIDLSKHLSRKTSCRRILDFEHPKFGSFYGIKNDQTYDTEMFKIKSGKLFTNLSSSRFYLKDIPENFSNHILPLGDLLKPPEVKVIDCSVNQCNNYDVYEKKCFKQILDIVLSLLENESCIIINFFPLTMFNVNLLYSLKFSFNFIGCKTGQNQILLIEFQNKSKVLENLSEVLDKQVLLGQCQLGRQDFRKYLPFKNTNPLQMKSFDETVIRFYDPKYILRDDLIKFVAFYNDNVFGSAELRKRPWR